MNVIELNVLVVDDEILETEYLLMILPQTGYTFQSVQSAFNIESAKEILKAEDIDILLCDIEMPQGSGLDLLRWVREEGMDVEALIITSHPEFSYAQQAVQLASVDYLLKPVMPDALKKGIGAAIERLASRQSANSFRSNRESMKETFFRHFIEGDSSFSEEKINASLKELEVPYRAGERMMELYFRMNRSMQDEADAEAYSARTFLLNMIQEILFAYQTKPWLYFPENNAFFMAFPVSFAQGNANEFYSTKVQHLMETAKKLQGIDLACFPGQSMPFAALPEAYGVLRRESGEVFTVSGGICRRKTVLKESKVLPSLKTDSWKVLLEHGRSDRWAEEITPYLDELKTRKVVRREEIYRFGNSVVQAVTEALKADETDPGNVLSDNLRGRLRMRGQYFLDEFDSAVREAMRNMEEYTRTKNPDEELIDRARRYIDSHVTEDLDRRELAEILGVSPDYLSRLFHAKAGMTLVAYITKAKLAYACRLFETTNCSVNAAAEQVGYTNFSYFSKLFRDAYGCTPQEYRKRFL